MLEKVYTLVDSLPKLQELIAEIKSTELISFDIETNSLNPRKGKIIGFSVSTKEGNGWYLPTLVFNGTDLADYYIDDLQTNEIARRVISLLVGKKLIGHNLSFDCRFVKCYYDIDLVPSIYADTLLLVHTCQEEGAGFGVNRPFGLKEIAKSIQQHIGLDVEKEANEEQNELKASIKANLGSTSKDNYEIFKADLKILAKYAAADTDLTLRVFNHFFPILQSEGLEKFFLEDEVMPLYREVTIPMEQHGVKLDMPLITKAKETITQDLEKYHQLVIKELLDNPDVRSWCILKATDTYPASNRGTFAQELIKYYNLDMPISEKNGKYSITNDNIKKLEESKIKDFLATGDVMHLDEDVSLKISMKLWKEENGGKYFNLNSRDHMGQIAFGAMGIKQLSETKTGRAQFDDELIQSISDKHPWAKTLRIYNKLVKISSTYIDRFLESEEDGKYYFYYKQHATVSSRYGSDSQQLPRPLEPGDEDPIIVEYTNMIRAFFIPEEGNLFIDDDYESLEPKVFSHVAGDEGLKDIFRNGWDFYSTIAIKTEGLNQFSPDKKAENYLRKLEPAIRNKAKGYSLGVPYGMQGYALAMTIGVSKKEGQKLVDDYLNAFPELKNWMESSRKFTKEHGYIRNQVGRIRHLPKVKAIYSKLGDSLMDYKSKKELEYTHGKDKITNLYRDYKNGLNSCCNFQIQSMAAAIVNRSAIEINRKFKLNGIKGQVVAQIHDQLVMEVEADKAHEAAKIVQECMENTVKLDIDLVAPAAIAKNWKDGH
jgi:DNA polymerase I-like protein with 3'-5' exonuclease and polymerase domains